MANILISLGSVIREKGIIEKIINISENELFLVEQKHKKYYRKLNRNQKITFERNLLKKNKLNLKDNLNFNKLYKITEKILSDQNCFFLLSRKKLNYFEYSPMRLNEIAVNLINNSFSLIIENKIEHLIIHNTPHAENWFLFRTAELMGKKIYIIRESIIPGYSRIFCGLTEQKLVNWWGGEKNLSNNIIKKFIKEKTEKKYNQSIPGIQKERRKIYNGGYSGFLSESRFLLKEDSFNLKRTLKAKLSVIKTVIFKNEPLDFYQKNTKIKRNSDLSKYKPFITFFLQYQPERTSMPEANSFSFQYKTILFLKKILPKNINLLIKEHPDTYRNKFSPRFKSKETYKNLLTLPGLFLCDLDIDPFSLLDESLMVSTLTGNVGIESICRGKKIIFFGNAIFKDYPFATNGCDKNFKLKLKEFLSKPDKVSNKIIHSYINNYMKRSYKNNFENFSTKLLEDLLKQIKFL